MKNAKELMKANGLDNKYYREFMKTANPKNQDLTFRMNESIDILDNYDWCGVGITGWGVEVAVNPDVSDEDKVSLLKLGWQDRGEWRNCNCYDHNQAGNESYKIWIDSGGPFGDAEKFIKEKEQK